MKIAIIIPTFNRKEYLQILLRQLFSQTYKNFVIIVVVDGSIDGTYDLLRDHFTDVIVVRGTGNWWYTKSINAGFKKALNFKPDYILTLNDDIEIKEDYLQNLVNSIQKVGLKSIVGSISFTYDSPHLIITSGVKKITWWGKAIPYIKMFSLGNPKQFYGIYISYILPGRGMLIPISIMKELNGFDEGFLQYNSDADFCLRAQKKNYKVFISWDSQIFSHIKMTSKTSSYIRTSFMSFLSNFFNKYSRIYIPNTIKFYSRHGLICLAPLRIFLIVLAQIKAFFFNRKL